MPNAECILGVLRCATAVCASRVTDLLRHVFALADVATYARTGGARARHPRSALRQLVDGAQVLAALRSCQRHFTPARWASFHANVSKFLRIVAA
jgi:hypothetical protein